MYIQKKQKLKERVSQREYVQQFYKIHVYGTEGSNAMQVIGVLIRRNFMQ